MHFIEIFCRMKLCKAWFIFFFGKSRFLSFLKLSVPIVFTCSFTSLTSCSFNITTLWHLLGGLHPSSCWQPSSFQYIITEQGGFLKENKQMSRLQLLLGRQVPGNKHFVSKAHSVVLREILAFRFLSWVTKAFVLPKTGELKAMLFPGHGTSGLGIIQGFQARGSCGGWGLHEVVISNSHHLRSLYLLQHVVFAPSSSLMSTREIFVGGLVLDRFLYFCWF